MSGHGRYIGGRKVLKTSIKSRFCCLKYLFLVIEKFKCDIYQWFVCLSTNFQKVQKSWFRQKILVVARSQHLFVSWKYWFFQLFDYQKKSNDLMHPYIVFLDMKVSFSMLQKSVSATCNTQSSIQNCSQRFPKTCSLCNFFQV